MQFRELLAKDSITLFDGATGTMFQSSGMPAGLSAEKYGLERPDIVRDIHLQYLRAGTHVVTTNTFQGSRFKLEGHDIAEHAKTMVAIAREACDQVASETGAARFVAASIGPSGLFVRPMGKLDFRDLVEAYKEQVRGFVAGGADCVICETYFDLAELRAAVIAVREASDLPVISSMTFEGASSLTGASPLTYVDSMQNLGVDVVSTNCSAGPDQIYDMVKEMLPRLATPLLVQPNAGLPVLEGDKTVFKMGPAEFAEKTARFLELGATLLGGCCGTTPGHIEALAKAVEGRRAAPMSPVDNPLVLTSRSRSVPVGPGHPFAIIGERVNPTGKKKLTAELQAGSFTLALDYARQQEEAGAPIVDVNVGAPMVDEARLLPELVLELVGRSQTPLCLDSSSPEAIEAALPLVPGSALINSISGEPGRMERLAPLARRYGAPFILLPLEGKKLPEKASQRIELIERMVAQAEALGVPRRLIMVDALVLTVSSKPDAALECLKTIRHVTESMGVATTMGLSNISFGLPARPLVNESFLAMAMGAGLTAAIANPCNARFMEAVAAAEVLTTRDRQAERFIRDYAGWKPGESGGSGGPGGPGGGPSGVTGGGARTKAATIRQAVVKGDKDHILELVEAKLQAGAKPYDLVNEELIPGITDVGELYEKKEYFLPQLLLSAETMQKGFGRLKPLLEEESGAAKKPVVVLATVEGDIHDIGKNIVALMLGNHGFEVLDMGKDVPAADIVALAKEKNAAVIGLSALMTTTMVRMRDTVDLVKEQGLEAPVVIGGAVITEDFCKAIGADGFALDAVAAVRLVKNLVRQ